jgi:hypothetical protein
MAHFTAGLATVSSVARRRKIVKNKPILEIQMEASAQKAEA